MTSAALLQLTGTTVRALLVLLMMATATGGAHGQAAAGLDPEERSRIVALGPWPPRWSPDPSNRVSGMPEAAALGKRLFFDERLSRFGVLSCAGCHKPDKAWGDGRMRASAAAELDRNTPHLFDVRQHRWFGWDGGADSLWAQSIRPILDPREMGATPSHVQDVIVGDLSLAASYARVFGVDPKRHSPERSLVNTAKALAAFQETIVSPRTPFDAFRDALKAKDPRAMADYPAAALRGLKLFVGEAQCATCHAGPHFAMDAFHDVGVSTTVQGTRVDRGRASGFDKLVRTRYRRDSRWSDDRTHARGAKSGQVPRVANAEGAFRVPTLRNVAETAPYMHNGSVATLAEAVQHGPRGHRLSSDEIAALVAFLETLSAARVAPR